MRAQREGATVGTAVFVVALGWLCFVLAHRALSGRWWLWLVFSPLPPAMFVVVPLAVGTGLVFDGPFRPTSAAAAFVALVVGADQAGLDLRRRTPPTTGGLRIVSWNTEHWHSRGRPEAIYAWLRELDADIYLLQEYHHDSGDGGIVPIDKAAGLRQAFPMHELCIGNHLVTLSRLPVLAVKPVPDCGHTLRVDVAAENAVLSTYNVHIPVQLRLTSPLRAEFYREMRRRAARRDREYGGLTADVVVNPNPSVIAGDFNTTPAMGEIRRMRAAATAAPFTSGSRQPASWHARSRLRWWRLDWLFVTTGASVRSYRFLPSDGLSDHCAQEAVITIQTRSS
jgi:endonuclease/exonuclease/phosphatase (EEP) superfamily protein YafD